MHSLRKTEPCSFRFFPLHIFNVSFLLESGKESSHLLTVPDKPGEISSRLEHHEPPLPLHCDLEVSNEFQGAASTNIRGLEIQDLTGHGAKAWS